MNTRKLRDVKLTLRKGEILGLVGLVGSGRTELVRALFGADKVASKSIYLDGKPVAVNSPIDAINLGLGHGARGPEAPGLVARVLCRAEHLAGGPGPPDRARLHRSKEEGAVSDRQIKALNIKTPSGRTKIRTLSGGNQQKAILGRWLEMNPRVLVMDEPTKGIDVGAKYEIYLLMKKIVEGGGSIILISSELPEVLHMSNRVNTICEGRVNGEFDPSISLRRRDHGQGL